MFGMIREYFSVKPLGKGITLIRDLSTVQFYLIEGTIKAALIDTGTGIGNLKAKLNDLTDLPLVILNTHGHVDHTGGDQNFDEVWISEQDKDLLPLHGSPMYRKNFAEFFLKFSGKEDLSFDESEFPVNPNIRYRFLKGGDTIYLGGRHLTCIPVPGHTRGSIGYLDSGSGSFFAGDCGNPSTFLFGKESTTVEEYRESLAALWDLQGEFDYYYIFHDLESIPKTCITDLIECCDDALMGKDSGIPFVFPFGEFNNPNTVWAAAVDSSGKRTDGRVGNLIFDKTRLQKLG
jgi:glyoxylase-like metal-dependent hydrolase (beta-lactamase superfamily II)